MAKRKRTAQETRKAMPAIKEFNSLSKMFIRLLNTKISQKEKRVGQIKIMVGGMKRPMKGREHLINVQSVDIRNTTIKKKGEYSFRQKMNWEDGVMKKKHGVIL